MFQSRIGVHCEFRRPGFGIENFTTARGDQCRLGSSEVVNEEREVMHAGPRSDAIGVEVMFADELDHDVSPLAIGRRVVKGGRLPMHTRVLDRDVLANKERTGAPQRPGFGRGDHILDGIRDLHWALTSELHAR